MTALETDCLKQDDVRLFHKGACHIFAATLKAKFANEAYVLKRVLLKREFDMQGAHHVFAAKGEFVVDASGIKRAADYIAWATARYRETHFGTVVIPLVEMHDTSEEELLNHHHDDPHLGAVNCWSLFSGAEFSAAARNRAEALIQHWPEKYQVSVLQAGQTLSTP